MIDVNTEMRRVYVAALSDPLGDIKLYFGQAPDDITDSVYAVIENEENTDYGNMNKGGLKVIMKVTIHSFSPKYNNAVDLNNAAGIILENIKGSQSASLTASGFQISGTRLIGDRTTPYKIQNRRNYIDRTLIFEHTIHFNS